MYVGTQSRHQWFPLGKRTPWVPYPVQNLVGCVPSPGWMGSIVWKGRWDMAAASATIPDSRSHLPLGLQSLHPTLPPPHSPPFSLTPKSIPTTQRGNPSSALSCQLALVLVASLQLNTMAKILTALSWEYVEHNGTYITSDQTCLGQHSKCLTKCSGVQVSKVSCSQKDQVLEFACFFENVLIFYKCNLHIKQEVCKHVHACALLNSSPKSPLTLHNQQMFSIICKIGYPQL